MDTVAFLNLRFALGAENAVTYHIIETHFCWSYPAISCVYLQIHARAFSEVHGKIVNIC